MHGDCEVSYAVTEGQVIKSVSHMADCKNRKYRLIDDWRGYRCDMDYKNPEKKESVDGLYSMANTVYKIEKVGGNFVIKGNDLMILEYIKFHGIHNSEYQNVFC